MMPGRGDGAAVVRWSISDVTDADTYAITLHSAVLDPHEHIACVR